MLKLSGEKLSVKSDKLKGNQLKILYYNKNRNYKLICNGEFYDLEKIDAYLIWNIPSNISKENLAIKVLALDENSGDELYITNQIIFNKSAESFNAAISMLSNFQNEVVYDGNYLTYEMLDEHPPLIISNRKISVPTNGQIIVSRDNVSQLLTFETNRYYDGVDLSGKACGIKYINAKKVSGKAIAVNVKVTEDKLTFGWLLDDKVSASAGTVKFAVEFLGKNEFDQLYVWQTMPADLKIDDGIWVDDAIIEERYPTIIEDIQIQLKSLELLIDSGGDGTGSGVSKIYVDNGDNDTLDKSKQYTDNKIGEIELIPGSKGDTGQQGSDGKDGLDGKSAYEVAVDNGFTGTDSEWLISLKGSKGDQGEVGLQGLKGDTGLEGPKGDKGEDGTGVTILGSFGSDSDLPPTGTPGDSYLINGDLYVWSPTINGWDNVGNIQGPQGEVGPKGEKGEPGEMGAQGLAGNDGLNGKSAYEIALDNGFIGIESEWLDTLKGEKGEQGLKGDPGEVGAQGSKGDKGEDGERGSIGPAGQDGVQGIPGENGKSATITIGTTTTLSPGSSATVTNTGTVQDVILNFGIPKGADGTGGNGSDDTHTHGYDVLWTGDAWGDGNTDIPLSNSLADYKKIYIEGTTSSDVVVFIPVDIGVIFNMNPDTLIVGSVQFPGYLGVYTFAFSAYPNFNSNILSEVRFRFLEPNGNDDVALLSRIVGEY